MNIEIPSSNRKPLGVPLCVALACWACGSSSRALAAETPVAFPTTSALLAMGDTDVLLETSSLHPIDWVVIAVYILSTVALGWFYSQRQKSTQEYFVGSGHMNPLLIGVSLFATLLSTISYLAVPGEILGKVPGILVSKTALPIAFLIVAYGLLPFYMRQRVTSAYELLEERLGVGIRLLGAVMFLALRLVWMSLLVYMSANVIIVMLGIEEKWVPLVVIVIGLVAVTYTTMGGLRAVVITDLLQTMFLFGGAWLVIAMVTWDLGGFNWFPTQWHENWDTQPVYTFDPQTRITLVGSFLTTLVWFVCTAGGDQTSVQRFMATKDARAARRAYGTQVLVSIIVTITLGLVGLALLGYAKANPDQLPVGMDLKADADDMFPWYILHRLPVGVSGLVISAMFAAAMSSIDSGVNSITAVVMTDFLDRFGFRSQTEKGQMRTAKYLALGIGVIVVFGSSFMGYIPGNITAVSHKTANLLVSPIFCLFFFAIFVPFATPVGVLLGALCGIATAALIAFSGPFFGIDPETGLDPISFQWIGPAALLVNIVVGTLASLVFCRTRQESS